MFNKDLLNEGGKEGMIMKQAYKHGKVTQNAIDAIRQEVLLDSGGCSHCSQSSKKSHKSSRRGSIYAGPER